MCPTTFPPIIRLSRGAEVLAERGSMATLHISIRGQLTICLRAFFQNRLYTRGCQVTLQTEAAKIV